MFLRESPTQTLGDLAEKVEAPGHTVVTSGERISIVPDEHGGTSIRINDLELMPFDGQSAEAVCAYVGAPRPFVRRLLANGAEDIALPMMNALLERHTTDVVARVSDLHGVLWIRDGGQKVIEPRAVVEVAARVLGESALVVEHELTTGQFYFDAFHPTRELGDKKVKDITRAGLRFGQNLAQNLAPTVAPFMYRLICTNGMQTRDDGLAVDARGKTVDQIIADLESSAQRAFARVEKDVEHFYAMRDVPVDNPERQLSRMATEAGLSDRLRLRLMDQIPTVTPANGDDISMFDLVNMVTNTANDPAIAGRRGLRVALESFAGRSVDDHAARCRSCAAKLN